MTAFYIDNDVAIRTAQSLIDMGHHAATARDLNATRFHDHEQLIFSTSMDRVIVSHNARDFRLLHSAWVLWTEHWRADQRHGGIVIVPQGIWNAYEIAENLDSLTRIETDFRNKLFAWRPDTGWTMPVHQRHLPSQP